MAFEIRSLQEKGVYTIYPLYKSMEKDLESREILTEENQITLSHCKTQIAEIEKYTNEQRDAGIRWSLTSLFKEAGMNPTLILEFYPGSESYKKFGKEKVVNIEFSDEDLKQIFESMRENLPRVTGQLKFKTVPEFFPDELNTGDIFGIQFAG